MKYRIIFILGVLALLLMSISPITAQEASAFPVTIEHKYGSTTITEAPERVVSIGFNEHDTLFALGIAPIAVRYWYGEAPHAIFPWAEEAANGAEPIVLEMAELNFEAILALQPDLITAVYSGITEEQYKALSEIAPTIAQSGDYIDYGMPWQETTLMIGAAVGKSAEAEAIVARIDTQFAEARAAHPEFEGKTIAITYNYNGGVYGYYAPEDPRGRFFENLGFVIPDELVEIAGDSFFADLSPERVDLLDQDVIAFVNLQFVEGGVEGLEADPLFSQLQAVQDGRVLYLDETVENALHFGSPLSLEFALENIVPGLAAVVDGDSAPATSCEAGFRLVVEVCVPENPQRVVTLSDTDLDAVLALDVEPIGITNGRGQSTTPRYLADFIPAEAIVLGDFFTPNLEVLLEAEPDVILVGGLDDPAVLEQLNAIAPVVDTYANGYEWQTHFLTVADVLNKQAEADEFIAAYDARIVELQTTLADHLGEEFIAVRWSADGPQVMAPITFVSTVLFDLGLTSPADIPELESGHAHSAPLSLETLGVIDVDWAFLGTLQGEGDAVDALNAVSDNPLFQALDVVKDNRVFFIDGSLWTSSGGPLAVMLVLDDVEAAITGAE